MQDNRSDRVFRCLTDLNASRWHKFGAASAGTLLGEFMRIFEYVLISILFSVSAFAQNADFSNQAGMESALSGVTKIGDLINSPDRLEKYYLAANDYYQGKLTRENFDAIVVQMRVLSDENPDFGTRLLSAQPALKSYSIVSNFKTYGRDLNLPYWSREKKKFFGSDSVSKKFIKKNEVMLEKVSNELRDFEISISGMSKKDAGLRRGEFYQAIKTQHKDFFQKIVGSIFYHDTDINGLVTSRDPDLLLFVVDKLLKDKIKLQKIPENLLSMVGSTIPKVSELLRDNRMFPIKTFRSQRGTIVPVEPLQVTEYKFIPFQRRLHAVWKGIWLGECVGGGNTIPTPRRWASVVLNSTNNYAVEKNNSFVGFIQEVGIKKPNQHAVYYATEFGMPNLKESVIVMNSETGIPIKAPMIDQWIAAAPKNIVRVKSDSQAINNAGVIGSLINSAAWNLRSSKGEATDYELADQAFANQIISATAKNSLGTSSPFKYGTGMITDATVDSAGSLIAISNVKWTEASLKKYIQKGDINLDSMQKIASFNTDIFARLNKDQLIETLFSKMVNKNPVEFIKILNWQRPNLSNPDLYFNNLMEHPYANPIDKFNVLFELNQVEKIKEYVSNSKIDHVFAKLLFSKLTTMRSKFVGSVEGILRDRILDEKIKDAYPILIEYGSHLLGNSKRKMKFALAIAELNHEDRIVLEKILPFIFRSMWSATDEYRLTIAKGFFNAGITDRLRAAISADQSFSIIQKRVLGEEFNLLMLNDAVSNDDRNYIVKLFATANFYDEFAIVNKSISLVLRSNKPELIDLLNNQMVEKFIKRIKFPKRQLSAEAQVFYDLKYPQKNMQFVSGNEFIVQIKKLALNQIKTLAAVHADQPAKVLVETTIPAKEAKLESTQSKKSVLDESFEKILTSTDPNEINRLQTTTEHELKKNIYLNESTALLVKSFLNEVLNHEEIVTEKIYSVMAIFEIAAQHKEIDFEIYEKSRTLGDRILSIPTFVQHRHLYANMFVARTAPIKCLMMFN